MYTTKFGDVEIKRKAGVITAAGNYDVIPTPGATLRISICEMIIQKDTSDPCVVTIDLGSGVDPMTLLLGGAMRGFIFQYPAHRELPCAPASPLRITTDTDCTVFYDFTYFAGSF